MPMGIRQTNNFLHSTLDVWHNQVFFNEEAYPAGYFAASVLNISMDEINSLMEKSGALLELAPLLMSEDPQLYNRVWLELRHRMITLAEALWQYEPFSHTDRGAEQRLIDTLLSKEYFPRIITSDSREQDFFMGYISALIQLPHALYHFMAAGRFFELDYLRRLKRRDESYFVTAAHDCFNSDLFWQEMKSLANPQMEPLTLTPQLRSSYVFAQNPKREKEMVFVQRIFFDSYMDMLCFDLLNGLHHGHAPNQCQCCGKYFLTTNARTPKYCDGIAPQDPRLTCRQYGAQQGHKEKNKNHPVYALFRTQTNTIRKHAERGKIDEALRTEALKTAAELRDKALMDNAYAEDGYKRDMELDAVYDSARKRLAQKGTTLS